MPSVENLTYVLPLHCQEAVVYMQPTLICYFIYLYTWLTDSTLLPHPLSLVSVCLFTCGIMHSAVRVSPLCFLVLFT